MSQESDRTAFPALTSAEMALLQPLASIVELDDGAVVFRAGDTELDLFVVEAGGIEIRNPTDGNAPIAVHNPGEFAGDIDVLTGRPVIVSGFARGRTRLLRVPSNKTRELLNRVPSFSEKLILAFMGRRELLSHLGKVGLKVIGAGHCQDTNRVREFLYKNFVPFNWQDSEQSFGRDALAAYGLNCRMPVVDCGEGRILQNPSLRELAKCAGIWRACPTDTVDLVIVGAGPAGISAAVYAASEGLSTLLLDSLGPGGQAGASTLIENFVGFPAGLSGEQLATRGVLQMLKFNARMVAPIAVQSIDIPDAATDPLTLHTDCGARVRAKVALVSTGVKWRKLAADGAERFERAGVHYVCTTVEAILYDGCDVAVVGGGNSAGQAAMHLAECCRTRTVHLLVRGRLGVSMSDYLVGRLRSTSNVTVHEATEIIAVEGDRQIEQVVLKNSNPDPNRLRCNGIFVFIGADPAADWLPSAVARDKLGYILTGASVQRSGRWPLAHREPCPLETTVPRLLAAGDVRADSTKRVGFAVGDGSLAVACVHRLLIS